MNFTVTPEDVIRTYGLSNVTYFPRSNVAGYDERTAAFLSSVGLPTSDVFTSRMDVEDPYGPETDAITLGSRFELYGLHCPPESQSWWSLGYLFTSLLALDPKSGKVYAFPEGAMDYIELHRDIESLVFALIELRKVEVDHDNDIDPEELAARFREVVGAFDETPFADEDSQWNLSLEELENGIW
ncbi:SUKH-4 family immunity protein [Streptomyces sp. ISL-36]|uniref:SUKH-4 family immunity protein n=1 Tax=Streptomyces sp. ISL-36 TaxID=2819182 RepID=UPI001BEC914E|nr:SUKH-4 family immunity protein [Streptomyces sp. ISL-36]MBT2439607.1 SUKH-4 family immunity protein [Streptomyces sp. ISL-36]